MQVALSELKKNFSYIVNEYHIPENIFISKTAAFAVDYMAKFLPFVGGVTAIDDILGSKKKKITSEDIPDDIMDTNKEKFYKMLSRYCDDRGYTESELYNKACVSKAVCRTCSVG